MFALDGRDAHVHSQRDGNGQKGAFQRAFNRHAVRSFGRQHNGEVAQAAGEMNALEGLVCLNKLHGVDKAAEVVFHIGTDRGDAGVDNAVVYGRSGAGFQKLLDEFFRGVVRLFCRVTRGAGAVYELFAGKQNRTERLNLVQLEHFRSHRGDGIENRLHSVRLCRVVGFQPRFRLSGIWRVDRQRFAGNGLNLGNHLRQQVGGTRSDVDVYISGAGNVLHLCQFKQTGDVAVVVHLLSGGDRVVNRFCNNGKSWYHN